MNWDLMKLYSLLQLGLKADAPVMSGNLKSGIKVKSVKGNEITLEIDARFYDVSQWSKTGRIKYTGKSYDGITNYAMWLNDKGAFGSGNKSMHWVNRVCNDVSQAIANQINAQVVNELPLD